MNQKFINFAVITIVVIAAVVFVRTFVDAGFRSARSDIEVENTATLFSTANQNATSTVSTSAPIKLRIPRFSVSATIQRVGIAKSGAMAVPTNYTDVGWYRAGITPGEPGVAFFDGHVDNGFGLPGVFKHLGELKHGNEILIDTVSGETFKFIVTDVTEYAYDAPETTTIFDAPSDGKAYIRLITCGGVWLSDKKMYDKRIVVTARRAAK